MERLKQALDRARAERAQGKPSETERLASSGGRAREPSRSTSTQTRDVVYQQTRGIEIDPRRLRDRRIVTPSMRDPAEAAYKVLRTTVLQKMRANGWNTLGVTGARQGNGKTLTTLNLAISLAREMNQTVLVADFDLCHPAVARYLLDEPVPGISDYLRGEKSISEILFNPGIERLVVLPGNEPMVDSSEKLSSPLVRDLVGELKTRYPDRFVLFDLPPVLAGDDVMAFAPNVDAFLLVVEDGVTTKDDLRRAYETLGASQLLGTVLNKAVGDHDTYAYA
ncbi:CpsD/CapB family tyrosine-protein kinase [Thiocapsa bogorovii]|uniref:CpsD/CapB family tyrosine-protein kinase n=1 Tax=Thiocapsa bogorovii TaxID=521689 RepID=UPI001E2F3485|nr:CpsD/CapB family tyrosine-protein kinase [Thiocapsa bogorovii]UHD17128.1 CpsD/CapB family tyrosine-protein kinase [Thiocapsa bogorovii]